MGVSRAVLVWAVLATAGCYSVTYQDPLQCSDKGLCPSGMHCEVDNFCHAGAVTTQVDAGMGCSVGQQQVNRKVDLLFVIDNSGSMEQEQAALTIAFDALITELSQLPGGLPDLHVGVVSSNMGALNQSLQGCTGSGDNGALQNTPRVPGCTPATGRFISDLGSPTGRVRNYSGTIQDAFACVAKLGIAGCGFEQHLASMERALDPGNATNTGFLRPEAILAVIILADEDDCSGQSGSQIFTPSASQLGPLTSYRCFEHGVKCSPDLPRTTPGPRALCVSREDSTHLVSMLHYVDFVTGLKAAGSEDIFVGTIVGSPTPVEVGVNASTSNPELLASCSSALGEAAPGVRLAQFTRGVGGQVATICANDYTDTMRGFASGIAAKMVFCP